MTRCVVGVDVGKTMCRVAVQVDGESKVEASGTGIAPTTGPSGVRHAARSVAHAVESALADAGCDSSERTIAIGMAGVTVLSGGAGALADALTRRWPDVPVAVTTDAVTAHAGGLGGEPGVVLAVGTGSVALGITADGTLHRTDGWGQWLGDEGSGSWIGREALRAAARASDGRAKPTVLVAAAERRFGELAGLPARLAFDASLPTTTASFVPDVITAAGEGDDAASEILTGAGDAWAESTLAAVRAVGAQVATCVGGLAEIEPVRPAWESRIRSYVKVAEPRGSAVDGAVLIAERADLPHEAHVCRRTRRLERTPPGEDLDVLETEAVREGLEDLDVWETDDVVDAVLSAEAKLPGVLNGARDAVAEAVNAAEAALARGGRIVYVGAGTPGRLAALDAAECPPTFGVEPGRVVAVLAGGEDASTAAVEGAEDRIEDAARAMADHDVGPDDVVVGISASGRTPYVLTALRVARTARATTVAVVNNPDSVIADAADIAIEILTGAEVISGSTRLTAGTAQKVTLNALTTATMIRLGKTYGPRMVDVVASNHKLRRRACRIVREVCAVDDTTALETLEAADWRTKPAIVALLAGVDIVDARARLVAADDRVRAAVEVEP